MKDIVIEWLEIVMNKSGIFYFKQNEKEPNLIDCYFKVDNTEFCTFYRDAIEKLIEME